MTAPDAIVEQKKRIPMVWVIPVFALIFGIWIVITHELNKGPEITIEFTRSEGVVPEKTKIKARSVEIGSVSHVELSEDFDKVIVRARIDKEYEKLLRQDSRVWVVRPRFGAAGISGLGTLLSGAYIELSPGSSEYVSTYFVGMDSPPLDLGGAGLRINLESESAHSVDAGDPVSYKGYTVGRIIDAGFDHEQKLFRYTLYVDEEFSPLVTSNTRFWNTSAVALKLDTSGVSIKISSLESFLNGGVSFEAVEGLGEDRSVADGAVFTLHDSYESMQKQPYEYGAYYWLLFDSSIRGLKVGAPVEYRGLQIGTVEQVALSAHYEDLFDMEQLSIPVLIRIDPGRFPMGDSPEGLLELKQDVPIRIESGLRAILSRGNLLTGAMYVNFEFFSEPGPYEKKVVGGYSVLPTHPTGVNEMENQIVSILATLEALPLQSTVEEIEQSFRSFKELTTSLLSGVQGLEPLLNQEQMTVLVEEFESALVSVGNTLKSWDGHSSIYFQLQDTFEEMSRAAMEIESIGNQLNSKPNSLIFSGSTEEDPQPEKK